MEWIPDPDQRGPSWSHGGPDGPISRGARISNRDAPSSAYPVDNQAFPQEQETYDDATEDPQQLCTPTAIPIWNDPMAFGTNAQQDYQKQNSTAWTPFHPALTQPSRFADLNPTGFSEVSPYLKHVFITPMRPYSNYLQVINTPTYATNATNATTNANTTCWQQQPSIYAWQISTKLKAPVTIVDQLMFSVINSQRHLHITSDVTGEKLIGPEYILPVSM